MDGYTFDKKPREKNTAESSQGEVHRMLFVYRQHIAIEMCGHGYICIRPLKLCKLLLFLPRFGALCLAFMRWRWQQLKCNGNSGVGRNVELTAPPHGESNKNKCSLQPWLQLLLLLYYIYNFSILL